MESQMGDEIIDLEPQMDDEIINLEPQKDDEIINLEPILHPLKGKQCFFNWVDLKFNDDDATERIEKRQCKKKCADIGECDYCKIDGDWRSDVNPTLFFDCDTDDLNKEKGYFHKFVSMNGEIAFLEAFIGEYEKAEKRLNYLDHEIDEYLNQDTCDLHLMEGYQYLSTLLQAFIMFRKDCFDHDEFAKIKSFQDLHTSAKVAVLSVKFNFYKECRGCLRIQAGTLRKLIELDPSNPSWYEKLGIHLRCLKKDAWKGQAMPAPSHEETGIFLRAYELKPFEPKFFVSFCRNIAEILKAKRYKSLDEVLRIDCTEHLFKTVEETLDFMKRNTTHLLEAVEYLEKNRNTAKIITTMGEVFSVSLPTQFADLDLAEKCILTAIQVSPTCSKANHRMGLFQWMKRNNYDAALEYLTTAVANKNENFYAVVDWIQLSLHRADEHAEMLEEVFDQILSKDLTWTKSETARLQFLKGCFLFIINGNETETINSWVSGYANDKSAHFVVAFSVAHRFKWDKNEWNIERILTFLKKFSSFKITKRMLGDVVGVKLRQEKINRQEKF